MATPFGLALLVLAQLPTGPAPGVAAGGVAPSPGNVLLLVIDDLGVDNVGAYGVGVDVPATPHLAELAQEGVLFRNAWSDPVCSPTRATIATGRHGARTGIGYIVVEGGPALGLEEVTVAESVGGGAPEVATAAFGKWHLGNASVGGDLAPNLAGFDHYAGALGNLHPPETYFSWRKVVDGEVIPTTGYITSDTVDDAVAWIGAQDGPWFAYVGFHAAHDPWHAPPPQLHTVDLTGAGDPSVDPRPYFEAMVEALDTEIGRLLAEAAIDLDETHVIVVGDNGTHGACVVPPFDPARAKGTVYQGGVRVPLLVAGPRVSERGVTCEALVNTTDLFATVVQLAGLDALGAVLGTGPAGASPAAPSIHDSVSLVPYLADADRPSLRAFAYTERFHFPQLTEAVDTRRAIRDGRWKLLVREVAPAPQEVEFYDLLSDPAELTDLLLGELSSEQQAALDQLSGWLAQLAGR